MKLSDIHEKADSLGMRNIKRKSPKFKVTQAYPEQERGPESDSKDTKWMYGKGPVELPPAPKADFASPKGKRDAESSYKKMVY